MISDSPLESTLLSLELLATAWLSYVRSHYIGSPVFVNVNVLRENFVLEF